MLQTGIKGKQSTIVNVSNTAKSMRSGELYVFATPAMAALVEEAAWKSVADTLEPGQGTVGTKLALNHISATPVGMTVWCDTELVEIDSRRLVFRFEVFDEAGKIGDGTHERFIVDTEAFMKKADGKLG